MKKIVTQTVIGEVKALWEVLAELNNTGKYTTFFNFSGHVCWINGRIYRGKWGIRKQTLLDQYIVLGRPLTDREKSEGKMDTPQLLEYVTTLKEQIR